MSIKKICPKCSDVCNVGYPMCKKCWDKELKKRDMIYKKNKDKDKQKEKYKNYKENREDIEIQKLYNNIKWQKIRKEIVTNQKGLCLYSLLEGKIAYVDIVHHIAEAKDNTSLFYSKDNLIGVSYSVHKQIHIAYEYSTKDKEEMQKKLLQIKEMTLEEVIEKFKIVLEQEEYRLTEEL